MFIFLLFVSFLVLGAIFYNALEDEATVLKVVIFVFGIALNMAAVLSSVSFGEDVGKVEGLVESGKYEIVTNEDYSLKELETFLKINGVYLKEVDNEEKTLWKTFCLHYVFLKKTTN